MTLNTPLITVDLRNLNEDDTLKMTKHKNMIIPKIVKKIVWMASIKLILQLFMYAQTNSTIKCEFKDYVFLTSAILWLEQSLLAPSL